MDLAENGKPIESVWDYPRPPRVEWVDWRIRVVHAGATVADSPGAYRVLETSQPPAYYLPPDRVDGSLLRPVSRQTFCEWKGAADYADVVVSRSTDGSTLEPSAADDADGAEVGVAVAPAAAWTYRRPTAGFTPITDHWAFYAQLLDECWVDDERVEPNEGMFYGGWITANVTGPFKGGPGTAHW